MISLSWVQFSTTCLTPFGVTSLQYGSFTPHPTFIPSPQHFTQTVQFTLSYKLKLNNHFHVHSCCSPYSFQKTFAEKTSTCITEPFLGGKFSDFVFLSLKSTSVTGNYRLRSSYFGSIFYQFFAICHRNRSIYQLYIYQNRRIYSSNHSIFISINSLNICYRNRFFFNSMFTL